MQYDFSALQVENADISYWLLDSGVPSHMTRHLSLFDSFTVYHYSDVVLVKNGKQLPIEHIGTITLHTSHGAVILNNVLHVSCLKQNLLSISQLTSDYNYVFISMLRILLQLAKEVEE